MRRPMKPMNPLQVQRSWHGSPVLTRCYTTTTRRRFIVDERLRQSRAEALSWAQPWCVLRRFVEG